MRIKKIFIQAVFYCLILIGLIAFKVIQKPIDDKILSYTADPKSQNLQLYWKNDSGHIFKSIMNLKTFVEKKKMTLKFAMNAGMYKKDNTPKGLFIQYQKILSPLDTSSGNGNFYLKPNGVFYITTANIPGIQKTTEFVNDGKIKFATQSGPMLVVDGKINAAFTIGSTNLNIRNGVGILPDKRIVFAISKKDINFYDFASFFKKLGCKNALYLDGLVSRMYLPEKNWKQTDGNFGVIIGVTEPNDK